MASLVDICSSLAADYGHAVRGDDSTASVSSVCLFFTPPSRRKLSKLKAELTNQPTFLYCRETLPRLDNYRISMRNLKRPSIGELQGEAADQVSLHLRVFKEFV